jgi:hypothetical protein
VNSACRAAELLFLAIENDGQDGRVEGFLLQVEQHVVVIDFDRLRGGFATVDDARYFASATQAAARTRPCSVRACALISNCMVILQVFPDPRPEREG